MRVSDKAFEDDAFPSATPWACVPVEEEELAWGAPTAVRGDGGASHRTLDADAYRLEQSTARRARA
jgi:hypothetical protein